MEIIFRKTTEADWKALQTLNNEVYEHDAEYDKYLDVAWPFSEEGIEYYKKITSSDHFFSYIALDGEVPVGHIVIEPKERGIRTNKVAEIIELGVSPQYRSQQIGSKLVDAGKLWCKDHGIDSLCVDSYLANEKGIAFYKRQGLMPLAMNLEMEL